MPLRALLLSTERTTGYACGIKKAMPMRRKRKNQMVIEKMALSEG